MFPYDNNSNPYNFNTNDIQKNLQQMMMPALNTQPQSIHVVKVNGRAGAESYNLPANSDCLLLDMNDPIAWLVQSDGAGYKTVTPYDISPHKEVKQEDVIKTLEQRITKLEEALSNGKSNSGSFNSKSKSDNFGNDASGRSNDKG